MKKITKRGVIYTLIQSVINIFLYFHLLNFNSAIFEYFHELGEYFKRDSYMDWKFFIPILFFTPLLNFAFLMFNILLVKKWVGDKFYKSYKFIVPLVFYFIICIVGACVLCGLSHWQ
jgi:hypothetical protein